ncbi:hypothetical protein HN014_00960 [Aquimarina sp. TRL1]|uniref:RHS repeat domain-containing protein n=1 Tax=Aquimarina sp. (strain TRL1) TaxID=2736252 RepID=UPI00158BB6E1|nr:3-coathanger stack domain-containing protein [Aquimarina sp. TRL1]QKX03540.1 hypothetical protein HN014_00960 [Aquimarina sp. TRL1]
MKHFIVYISFLLFSLGMMAQGGVPIGPIDGECTEGAVRYYYDYDRDGMGVAYSFIELCPDTTPNPSNYYTALVYGDQDDNDPDVTNVEKNWYIDGDQDTEGKYNASPIRSVLRPTLNNKRYVSNNTDCDDTDRHIKSFTWYVDRDGDGSGDKEHPGIKQCEKPTDAEGNNYVQNRDDCADTDETATLKLWYKDLDKDGFGDPNDTRLRCTRPDNFIGRAGDICPDVYGVYNGCPAAGNIREPWNTITTTTYDVQEQVKGKNKTYFNTLGKLTQSQSVDPKTKKTWASQILYDRQGRPALQTMSAPTNGEIDLDFIYREDFIKKSNGDIYIAEDFETSPENPKTVGSQSNTLGHYYSTQNQGEAYQDVTTRPYTRTIYSELTPGAVKKTLGGNRINGNWKNGYVFSMPAGQELSSTAAFGDAKYNNYTILKTVSRDVHGEENVVFTDAEGRTLAAARSGDVEAANRTATVQIREQNYVDIHIPKGRSGVVVKNDVGVVLSNNTLFDVYNLITETTTNTAFGSLPSGFYRIAYTGGDTSRAPIHITYPENYYDYSLQEYNKAGQLIASYQPLRDHAQQKLKSTFTYNALGQLTKSESPDEGAADFKYRKDGQIRFSQNSKQAHATPQEFSYTNYDHRGRSVESGVLVSTAFATADPDAALPAGTRKEQHFTVYDQQTVPAGTTAPSRTLEEALTQLGLNSTQKATYKATFLAGNVAMTYTLPETTISWYSYDIYGRVRNMVQYIQGLGTKTIDYTYDPVSGQVTQVDYQKYKSAERFMHRYSYDPDTGQLLKVETTKNGTNYTEHAAYTYYETGALKRTNIARGLQGIDYVYNLSGQLKAINHPSLSTGNDPGGDANDLFGMIIDYNHHDFNRPLRNIKSTSYGVDQYNGNIKGIRWNSTDTPVTGGMSTEHTYSYTYDRNNWLQQAAYGTFNADTASLPVIIDENTSAIPSPDDHLPSVNDILNSGQAKHLSANKSITLIPGFHAKQGSRFSARITAGSNRETRSINAGTLALNAQGDYTVDQITYDANGNIQTLHRAKQTENGNNAMDQLTYTYKGAKPNQLTQVTDAAGDVAGAADIGSQPADNYRYNRIGQLTRNESEKIDYLYNASGLVTEIHEEGSPRLKFFYNDKGQRVRKEAYANGTLSYTEHYVRDAAGNTMVIYRNGQLEEYALFGAGRIGVQKRGGANFYQLTDHLGNVRAVVSKTTTGTPIALTKTDYYPGGMAMPNRNLQGDYRYGYQGEFAETDPETGKPAFELRLYDPRINRWLAPDPYGQYHSPYVGMGNDWINGVDPDGGYKTKWGQFWGWVGNGFKGERFTTDFGGDKKYGISIDQGDTGTFLAFNKSDLNAVNSNFEGFGYFGVDQSILNSPFTGSFSEYKPNFFGRIEDDLNNSSGIKSTIGSAIYNTLDDAYVFGTSFDLLSPNNQPQRLNGTVVVRGSSEGIESGLNGMMTLATFGRIKKPTLNMGQFNSKYKGIITRTFKTAKIKGIILKNMNRFHKYWGQGMKGHLGYGKTIIGTVEGIINNDN